MPSEKKNIPTEDAMTITLPPALPSKTTFAQGIRRAPHRGYRLNRADTIQALSNALDHDRLHHAYLFTGTRGVGKTTLARIFAKSLNCEEGVSSTPCGVCSTCCEVDEGRFVDLLEVDAASRTKVDQTRELLENVPYAPARGRYKVYLIDEVHMFSDSSFNALLKTLEEPPPHVKFLLATTDPQKLPMTVLSRCLQFGLKRLTIEQIINQLKHILDTEGTSYEENALLLLAVGADGSMRDALSLLDQAISFGGGEVTESQVQAMLGTVSRDYVYGLLDALVAGDGALLMERIEKLRDRAPDYRGVLDELLRVLHRIAVRLEVPNVARNELDQERLEYLMEILTPEEVQLYYQIGLTGKRDLQLAPDASSGFEMVMLRMLAFRPDGGDSAGRAKSAAARSNVSPARKARAAAEAPPKAMQAEPSPEPRPAKVLQSVAEKPPIEAVEKEVQPQTTPSDESSAADWDNLIAVLSLGGIASQLAANCVPKTMTPERVFLTLSEDHQALKSEMSVKRLHEALKGHFGDAVELEIEIGEPVADTPARRKAREEEERLAEARSQMAEDPFVKAARKQFGAQVLDDTVKPN